MSQLHLQPVVPSVGPTAGLAQASETPTEAAAPDDAASQPPVVQLACQRVAQSVEQHVVPIAPAEAVGLVGVDATTQESACSPDAGIAESRDEAEPLGDRLIGRWAVLRNLKISAHFNGRLVRVGSRRANGRFKTFRPGSGDQLAVRPENLRGLLEKYDGRHAGDKMAFDDGELELLGFDPVEAFWACKKANMYFIFFF